MTATPRLPNPLTPEGLESLMRERPYRDPSHPRSAIYHRLVQRGFEILYPGNVRYGARGTIATQPLKPQYVTHLVVEANREMEDMDRAVFGEGESAGGAVHVQSHSRDGGKVEVSDYWRSRPGEGSGAGDSSDMPKPRNLLDEAADDGDAQAGSPQELANGDDDLPPMTNPVPGGRMRGNDGPPYGSGDFGASREGRRHEGVDIEAEPGTTVVSPVSGRVKIGDPYGDDPAKRGIYQSVRIETEDGSVVKVFYVKPGAAIQNGVLVKAGQPIGTAQDLSRIYPPKDGGRMTNHVHVEVWKNGRRKNPTDVLFPNKQ